MKNVKRWIEAILILVLIVSLAVILRRAFDQRRAARDLTEAAQLAGLTGPDQPSGSAPASSSGERPYDGPLAGLDLSPLRAVNEDVVGWLEIPDTPVSYPLVQGTDDQFYLTHNWKKEPSGMGSVFLEQTNSRDLTGFHLIIYAHRIRDGTMFGSLLDYKDPDYWQEHPSVYLADGKGVRRYDIFAAHEAGLKDMVYRLDLEDGLEEGFIQYCLDSSVIHTGIVPEARDQILTLSTCTARGGRTRWVVHGVLASTG